MRQVYTHCVRTPLYCRVYIYIFSTARELYTCGVLQHNMCPAQRLLYTAAASLLTVHRQIVYRKKNVYNKTYTYCALYFPLQQRYMYIVHASFWPRTRLGSFYFYFFFISILVLFTIVGRRSRADERLYNKLCRTSVVAVLRALRGLDKSPMRQIRYPHAYDIYIYRCTHTHTHTHTSPDRHERQRQPSEGW